MKRTILLILTILNSLSLFSYDFYVDGIYYRFFSIYHPDEVAVTDRQFYPYSGDIVIPNKVNYNGKTYSVTTIGDGAFSNCSKLTSIKIPNSVTLIGTNAFFCCTGLTSITIPNSVINIHDEAFHGCTGLTSVTIPNGVKDIGSGAFAYCRNLTSISIPQSIKSIGIAAFDNCNKLTKVSINCEYIGDWFNHKSSIKEVILGDGVIRIGKQAFYGCSGLTSITIPRNVENIYYDAFHRCNLTSVTINCKRIDQCFYDTSIKEVILGDGVTTIGNKAFSKCGALQSITIPNSVTSINDYAFSYCSSLASIIIPNSVKYLGQGAFMGCRSLTSVSISNSIPSIKLSAFSGCNSLTSVTIPNGVLSIQDKAFYGCSNITEVTISNSVTSIGHSAFWECKNIASVISLNTTPPEIEADSFDYIGFKNRNVTLYVPKGCRNVYMSKSHWKDLFNNIVELSNTGIDDVKTCSIARNQSVYTINGTKVLDNVENINSLPKGAYIINGKKLIIK